MSPALNGSSAVQRFEGSGVIEIRNGITFTYVQILEIMLHVLYVNRVRVRDWARVKFKVKYHVAYYIL